MPPESYSTLIERLSASRSGNASAFSKAQDESAERHFRVLVPFVRSGQVKFIVDVGCGSGALLKALAKRISEDLARNPSGDGETRHVILTGIDPDLAAPEAETSLCASVTLRFRKCMGESFCFPPDDTACMILGHTLFHLAKSECELHQFLHTAGALLWFVDVHRNWDDVVAALPNVGTFDEPSVLNSPGVVLRTERFGEEPVIKRGHFDTLSNIWKFETTQLLVGTGRINEIFEKLGYLVVNRYEHDSSWGPMITSVYAVSDARHWYSQSTQGARASYNGLVRPI